MLSKILIADDDDEIRELIKFFLEQEGYQVIEAGNGEEVINIVYADVPDLILLDVMMPKLTGFEVCEKLRSNAKTCMVPIIMLTSLAQAKDKITGIKLGADEYLTKPFENFELIARIEALLRRCKENRVASLLTGLAGNIAVESEIKSRLEEKNPFCFILVDINGFKVYNDKYSFEQGDDILRVFGSIIKSAHVELGDKDGMVAYMGEDDFVIITLPERADLMVLRVIENFENVVHKFYDADVLKRGYIWTKNENGEEIQHPLLTISMGVLSAEQGVYKHYAQVLDKTKGLLKEAKKTNKNQFVKG